MDPNHLLTLPEPPLCKREILRYAQCRSEEPQVLSLLEDILKEALPVLTYRLVYRRLPLRIEGDQADLGPLQVSSHGLAAHLRGCREVLLFAATLGTGLDRLLGRYSRLSPARAAMLQALGAERVEALCDAFEETLSKQEGLFFRTRFSPGYGDLPLSLQREICSLLEAEKWLGICLNESLLMSPSKSVTAFLGLDPAPTEKPRSKCLSCPKRDCLYRRP